MDDNDISADDPALSGFFPTSFGKKDVAVNVQAQIDACKRPIIDPRKQPKGAKEASSDKDSDDDSDDDDSDEEEEDEYPVSHELVFKTHEKPVTTMTLDHSGTRLVTGSTDCTLKLHDFSAMTPTTIRAFKSVDPSATKSAALTAETHPIHHVAFNPHSGGEMLVITALPQAKLFSRDGEQLAEYMKGDMYLRDMHNTKGHISEITTGAWHPTDRNYFVTAGTDSTLRIWDVNDKFSQKQVIVHKSRQAGSAGRTRMTAVAWGSPAQGGNNVLVSAALDGSLVMWSGSGPFTRPTAEIRDAHQKDTWTSGIDISSDGRLIITRGGDDTIKLWDTRKFKTPLNTTAHPSTSQYPTSNILFAPNSSSIITGSPDGSLHILNPATLRPELITPVTPGSPLITVSWHPRLHQILTGSANGHTHILFSPSTSQHGALSILSKAPKRRHIDDDPTLTTDLSQGVSGDAIVTPGAKTVGAAGSWAARHPTVGLTASGRSRDPRRPHVPQTTPFAKSTPDERHVRESIPLSGMRDEDPVEALRKYAVKPGEKNLFTGVWEETQPKTMYSELEDDEDGAEERKAKKVRR